MDESPLLVVFFSQRAGKKRIDGFDKRGKWVISCYACPCLMDFWIGEDSGLSRCWFTEGQWLVAVASGSQPASYGCPVPALCLPFTMLHVLSRKSHRQRKRLLALFALLFPVFCLIWGGVGSGSIKCRVRSVLLAVLCWHGLPNACPFCSETLPTGHVFPLKSEIWTVCVLFCTSILSPCNYPARWRDHNQTSVPAWCLAGGQQARTCLSPLLTYKLLPMLQICQRCLGA